MLRNTLLETFVTVVEMGGFTDAQYALGVTQSAISVRIRDLETILGYRVCERGRGGFHLTERGEIAYRKASLILRSARDFDAELMELRDALSGDLRIGIVDAVSSLPGLRLSEAMSRFLSRPNEIHAEIVVASPTDLAQGLITGQLHIAIAPFKNQIAGLGYVEICKEEHRLYCGRGHDLFELEDDVLRDSLLAGYPICQRAYDVVLPAEFRASPVRATVANMEAMAIMIESGHYLGALPAHYAESWVRNGKLRELNAPTWRWMSTFFVATRRARYQRRAVELFMQDLRREHAGAAAAPVSIPAD